MSVPLLNAEAAPEGTALWLQMVQEQNQACNSPAPPGRLHERLRRTAAIIRRRGRWKPDVGGVAGTIRTPGDLSTHVRGRPSWDGGLSPFRERRLRRLFEVVLRLSRLGYAVRPVG
jgi:hypothetical protein